MNDRSDRSVAKRKIKAQRSLVQRDQERKVRNGNVQMTNSTTLSGRPSLPATRRRLFKAFAAANLPRFYSARTAPPCPNAKVIDR